MRAFPKPSEAEGKITLSEHQRRKKRLELFYKQSGLCAQCSRTMSPFPDHMDSVTLDHILPEPAGCAKRDNDDNLRAVCWSCNSEKGSKRL